MTYIATVGLTNDKTGKRFKPGDKVTAKDFPAEVIKEWLEQGVLKKEAADGSYNNNG